MQDDALSDAFFGLAETLGFRHHAVARAEPLEVEGEQLRSFIANGRHGQMGWLANTAEVRADPNHEGMLPSAVSVVVFATPYDGTRERVGPAPGRIARYARGRDYHNVLSKRLRKLERWFRERGYEARHSVDSRPVFERAWAERSGLGFIGKNACLIVPGLGSHVFLSCIVTSAPLRAGAPMKRRCGRCRACLDVCPTDAFVGPRELDARRCISYLTIEHEGIIDDDLKGAMGDWLLGCDACQDVCPYNARARETDGDDPFAPDARWNGREALDLFTMDDETYRTWTEGTPMRRPGRVRMARNAALVLANVSEPDTALRKRALVVLRDAASDDDEGLRDAARWALQRLEG